VIRHLAAAALALTAALGAAPSPPGSAPAGVEILEDGSIVARPSGLHLPRTVRGPIYTHNAAISRVDDGRVAATYGPVTVTVGPPAAEADPIMGPNASEMDGAPPSLPSLLFWGEGAEPVTYSFLRTGPAKDKSWLSFVVVMQGWQIEISSLHDPAERDTIVRTAEAVWATLAAANANPPR
jgi:hypothetical protein